MSYVARRWGSDVSVATADRSARPGTDARQERTRIMEEGKSALQHALWRCAGLLSIRFHDLRHTCATLLLAKGVHPKLVQALLGHASIGITMDLYSHWAPAMGDQAAAAMEDALQEEDHAEAENETDAA